MARSALIFAIINGHYDVATLLVEKGANVNLADRTGTTPLYSAVDMHTMPTTFGRPGSAAAGGGGQRRRGEDAAGATAPIPTPG